MTGQILAVLMILPLRMLAIKTRAPRSTEEVPVAASDPADLTAIEWDFDLYNERDPLSRAPDFYQAIEKIHQAESR